MTSAESNSTNSSTESAQTADQQPSLVAISEENLAALLRATSAPAEPEAPSQVAEVVAAPQPAEPPAVETQPASNAPGQTVESTLALFAAVKEHRTAKLRSEVAPPAPVPNLPPAVKMDATPGLDVEQAVRISAMPASKTDPLKVTLPSPTATIPLPHIDIRPPEPDSSRKRLVIGLIAGGVLVVAGVSVFWSQTRTPKPTILAVATPAPQSQVELTAPPVNSAQPTPIPLPAPPQQSAPVKPQSVQPQTVEPQTVVNMAVAPETPQPSQPKPRVFIPAPAQRTTPQNPVVEAPPVLSAGPQTTPLTALPASLPAVLPPAGAAATPQQVRVESSLQAAALLKRVAPVYPTIAKTTGIHGTVRFTATIGKDGRIENLKLLSGPTVLADSAAAAVKQWIYRPTLLNGEPVEVVTQIDVAFNLR